MDLKAHEQALQNIRNKYSQQSYVPIKKTNFFDKVSFGSNKTNDLFKTPIKALKQEQVLVTKNHQQDKKQSGNQQNITLCAFQAQTRQSFQKMFSKKLTIMKETERQFQQILTEREKQLTERVERNKQLLSKSKEIRERESKNNSVDKNNTEKVKESSGGLNQLKLILKDKNYVTNDKANNMKKTTGIGINITRDQNIYSAIKRNFTDKIKQSLAQNFHNQKKKEQKKPEQVSKREIMPRYISNQKQQNYFSIKKKQNLLIKTPIPPPKESSPSKISSIFQNTQKIEERIHALLSR